MPFIQGLFPKSDWSKTLCGKDPNGRLTVNNVMEYRGRPYPAHNVIDQKAIDYEREVAKMSRQLGLRVVGVSLTTSSIKPSH